MRKKILVSLAIFILLSVIALEYYFYLKLDNNNNQNSNNYIYDKGNDKYLVDITESYRENGLEYKLNTLKNDKNVYYISISGLKNKKIENEINNKIKAKVEKLKDELTYDEYTIVAYLKSNFENTISVAFDVRDYVVDNSDVEQFDWVQDLVDTMNFDLNTGRELTILDVVNKKDALKETILKKIEEEIYENIGFAFHYYDLDQKADYGKAEDNVLSIMQQFDRDNYKFYYTPDSLRLYFDNVYLYSPILLNSSYESELIDECLKNNTCRYFEKNPYSDGKIYIMEEYRTEYEIYIPLYSLKDNLIIYDKFKTNKSLFESKGNIITRKFTNTDDCNGIWECIYFKETDNGFYDISLVNYSYDYLVLNENSINTIMNYLDVSNKGFQIDKAACEFDYLNRLTDNSYGYFKCNINYYNVTKDKFNKYKKDIYLNSYENSIIYMGEGYVTINKDGYDFFERDKEDFVYYIFDKTGKLYKPKDVISDLIYDFFDDEWISDKENLVNNMEIIYGDEKEIKNKLVLYIFEDKIYLKYNEKHKNLLDNYEYYTLIQNLFKEAI